MNTIKTTSFVAISIIVTLAIASIFGFQLSTIAAEDTEEKGYTFGENVSITGVFTFKNGVELYQFEVFDQKSGWMRGEPYVFQLIKIVGKTPILHQHADMSQTYRASEYQKKSVNEFDVKIILSNEGNLKRVFEYTECHVKEYFVETLFDKEEGWNSSKGFAVIDNFEIQCKGYIPHNPVYDEMQSTEGQKAHTTSSMDLKDPFPTWSDDFKYNGGS